MGHLLLLVVPWGLDEGYVVEGVNPSQAEPLVNSFPTPGRQSADNWPVTHRGGCSPAKCCGSQGRFQGPLGFLTLQSSPLSSAAACCR